MFCFFFYHFNVYGIFVKMFKGLNKYSLKKENGLCMYVIDKSGVMEKCHVCRC